MRIGVDVDGVLARFNESFAQRLVDVTGRSLIPTGADFPCWGWPSHYGYTAAEESATWENVRQDKTFWFRLGAYDDTHTVLLELLRLQLIGHDIYFITSRPGVRAKQQTEDWLRVQGFASTPTVLISSAKGMCAQALCLDSYVDDRWENVVDVAESTLTCHTCLLDRPWNQGRPHDAFGVVRVNSVLDVFK